MAYFYYDLNKKNIGKSKPNKKIYDLLTIPKMINNRSRSGVGVWYFLWIRSQYCARKPEQEPKFNFFLC